MKKLIYLLLLNTLFAFAFAINVKAATYDIEDLSLGQLIHEGDYIDFGDGTYEHLYHYGDDFHQWEILDEGPYTYIELGFNIQHGDYSFNHPDNSYTYSHSSIRSGQSWRVPEDLFYYGVSGWSTSPIGYLNFYLYHIKVNLTYKYTGENRAQVTANCEGGIAPYTYKWMIQHNSLWTPHETNFVTTSTPQLDVDCTDTVFVNCFVYDSSSTDIRYCKAGSSFYNLEIPENESSDNESSEEDNPEEDIVPNDNNPSTIPTGIAQVTIGKDNKTFANIKALNQFPHDAINQKIIADIYAAKMRKRADVLIQKNLFPPYGVTNEWKTTSHVVRWKDLSVKKGDTVLVVWYTPTFWGHTSNLKYITATVVEDGVIEFTIPAMGDMSVMSIVKLR